MSSRRQYVVILIVFCLVIVIAYAAHVIRDTPAQDSVDAFTSRETFARLITARLQDESEKWGVPEVRDRGDSRGPQVRIAHGTRYFYYGHRLNCDGAEVVAVEVRKKGADGYDIGKGFLLITEDAKVLAGSDGDFDKDEISSAHAFARSYWAALDEVKASRK
jgi:hypothetical protein